MIVYTKSLRQIVFLTGMLLFLAVSWPVAAQQEDDPNLDQVPVSLRMNPPQLNPPLSSVITISNWDNFNLGIDLAENMMVAHPQQPAWYFTAYNINTAHHTEDGFSWLNSNPGFGANMAGDPVSAYDSLGNLFYENMYGSPIAGTKVLRSADNGLTWDPAVNSNSGNDKCWIACDQTSGPYANYVYTTMTNNSVGAFSRSTDHGVTFQLTESFSTQSVPGMMVCVGPDGNTQGGSVYVVTNSGSSFASTYTFYRSTDGGLNFTLMSAQNFAGYVGEYYNSRNSVEGMRTRPYPYISADNSYGASRGRLYLVYASNDPPGNNNKPDIWCRYSTDNGITWSAANRVNDDVNPTQHNQWHPAMWCDKETGRLYVQWMDTRDCPTSDSALIYATYSDDGGLTFAPNQPISNKKMKISCPTCGGSGDPRYQGDYNGVISNKKVSMLGWTDFRDGSFMSMTGYFPDFAVTLDKSSDTLFTPLDSTIVTVQVPEIKLYTDTVLVSAVVNPAPTAGSIIFSYPLGTMMTTYPGTLPVQIRTDGLVPPGPYQVIFTTQSPNGTPVHKRTLNLRILLGDVFLVDANASPDTICQGASSQLSATVFNGTQPFTYAWTPAGGLSDPTIPNPVANPSASTMYHVTVTDATSATTTDSVLVSVKTAPGAPGQISGPSQVCQNANAGYSIFPVIGATGYSWTVPAGATIVSGQNSPAINVLWTDTPGTVSVIAANICGTSPPSVLVVSLLDPPGPPAAILGSDLGCKDEAVTLHVDTVPGATSYNWTVPADATITLGQGTPEIVVIWGSTSGVVSVSAENICGISASAQKLLPVDSIPGPAGALSGNDTVCLNHAGYEYSIPPVGNAQAYVWSVPEGSVISSGSASNVITVDFSPQAVSGSITVYAINDCGMGMPSTKPVIVSPCIGIPENQLNATVEVFPNPVNGMLNVRIRGNETRLELAINDGKGRTVFSKTLPNIGSDYTMQVDVSGYADGIYFIRLFDGPRTFSTKFVVKQ